MLVPPGSSLEVWIWGPASDVQNQKLWRSGLGVCVITSPRGDSSPCSGMRSAGFMECGIYWNAFIQTKTILLMGGVGGSDFVLGFYLRSLLR